MQITTADQYYKAAKNFNRTQHLIDLEIDRIPMNVNRAGATYRRLTKQIRERYSNQLHGESVK